MAAAYEKLLQFWQEKATAQMRAAAQDFVAVLAEESKGKDEYRLKLAELEAEMTELEADNRLKVAKVTELEAALEQA